MTTKEWKKVLTDSWISQPKVIEAYGLDPTKSFEEQFSKVSIESLLFYAQAYGLMVFDKLVKEKMDRLISIFEKLRPHTLSWYAEKIKAYQDECVLVDGGYELIDEGKQLVKFCSISEKNGILSAKIAGMKDGKPIKLDEVIIAKVLAYVNRVKDAGVRVLLSSGEADAFSCSLLIHYDPLITLSEVVINDAIISYLESMPFDGVYSNMALIDEIQKIKGVKVAELISSSASYGYNQPVNIVSTYVPDAGYMKLKQSLITFKSY